MKYCFRYNARNRAMRQNADGEHIDMGAVPRAHRRRREKKLMSLDEVNDRFPLTKYKTWINNRAAQGLSTAGGVAAPPSRAASMKAASIKEAERAIATHHETNSDEAIANTQTKNATETRVESIEDENAIREQIDTSHHHTHAPNLDHESKSLAPTTTVEDEDMDDDEHILNAVPTAMLENPGDSCAICIDTLEDDDDVRGLTCGHAFHASCIDPWLTSRRACCPLCKADYYVPKPRPEGEIIINASESGDATRSSGRRHHGNRVDGMPGPPQFAFMNSRASHLRGRMAVSDRWILVRHQGNRQRSLGRFPAPRVPMFSRNQRNQQQVQNATTGNPATNASQGEWSNSELQQPQPSRWTRFVPRSIHTPRLWNRSDANGNTNAETNSSPEIHGTTGNNPTPRQLEAGHR